jgi:hypothetical protein
MSMGYSITCCIEQNLHNYHVINCVVLNYTFNNNIVECDPFINTKMVNEKHHLGLPNIQRAKVNNNTLKFVCVI